MDSSARRAYLMAAAAAAGGSMEAVNTKKVYDTLMRYHTTLRNTGHVSIGDTRRVLVQMFLNEWMNSDMSYFMTEEYYKLIAAAVRNITGDCLIPYTNYCNRRMKVGYSRIQIGSPMLMGTTTYTRTRFTESDGTRYAETDNLRLAEGGTTLQD